MVERKKLRIQTETGSAIDFKVLENFTLEDWVEWVQSRLNGPAGQDIYGFPVGGTHARTEPSDYFYEVGEQVLEGKVFPNAEQALHELLAQEDKREAHSYSRAELTTIARCVTRPNLGHDETANIVASWLRNPEIKKLNPHSCVEQYIISSLVFLVHLQRFRDKQFLDIYEDFLKEREGYPKEVYFHSFMGIQKSQNPFVADEASIKRILQVYSGSPLEINNVFIGAGRIFEGNRDQYFKEINQRLEERKTKK